MAFLTITIPASTRVGQTVNAQVGTKAKRITLLTEKALRIEPDAVCAILSATTQDGETVIQAIR